VHPLLVSCLDMPWSLRAESSGGGELCGAVRCGAGKCDYCCGSAARLRVGDCAAVHSDGGPGAGCGDVCCDGACVLRFRCWFAHYPCSELRKPCITPTTPEQTTDLHRSLGTPRGGPLCNVAGAHRVAAADEETPMQLLKLCYPNIPPRLILSFISFDPRARRKSVLLLEDPPAGDRW
jgi:hypothetical protein